MNKSEIQEILNERLVEINNPDLYAFVGAIKEDDLSYVKDNMNGLNGELQQVALIYSITNDKVKIVEYMIDNNEKILENEEVKRLALLYYTVSDDVNALNYVLNRGIKLSKDDMYDILIQGCEKNAEGAVKLLMKDMGFVNFADLLIATNNICYIDDDLEKEITGRGKELLSEEERNEMLAHLEMFFGPIDRPDSKFVTQKYIELFDMLLKNGVSTSVKSEYGKTPLRQIIETKNGKLITKILEHHGYPRYNKDVAIGYDLRDLHIALEDIECVVKSEWYKKVKEQKASIKEDIKAIINCANQEELTKIVETIANKRQLEDVLKKLSNSEDVEAVARDLKITLKQKLNKTNDLLAKVERFKERVDLNTKNKVFRVIDLCKENGIKNLAKTLENKMEL